MKKIYCNKFGTGLLVLLIISLILFNGLYTFLILDMLSEDNIGGIVLFAICDLLLSSMFIIFIIFLNKLGCIIIYDKDNNLLIRKGCLFGYKSILSVDEILKIEKATFEKEGEYYIFFDKIHTKYEAGSKKSFFRIPYTKEGEAFIEQFYSLN